MADQGIWFKLWDGWENDGALAELSKEDMLHWVLLGGYLKKHGNNGMTCFSRPATALQKKLMLPSYEAVMEVLKKMPNCMIEEKQKVDVTNTVTVVTLQWKNWVKYQGDSSKIRTRKWRVTNRPKCDDKKRREEKREEEKRNIYPTLVEVQDFAKAETLPLDCSKFFNHFESKGWISGKSKIKNWKAAARNAASGWANSSGAVAPKGIPEWMRTK